MKKKNLLVKSGCALMAATMLFNAGLTEVKASSSVSGMSIYENDKTYSCRTFNFNHNPDSIRIGVTEEFENYIEIAKGETFCISNAQIIFNYSDNLTLYKIDDIYYITPKDNFTGNTELKIINNNGLVTMVKVYVNSKKIECGSTSVLFNTSTSKGSTETLKFKSTKHNVSAKSLKGHIKIRKISNNKFEISAKEGKKNKFLLDIIQFSANGKKYYVTVRILDGYGVENVSDYSNICNFDFSLGTTTTPYDNPLSHADFKGSLKVRNY